MNHPILTEIEERINQLSVHDQLRLMERLAQRLGRHAPSPPAAIMDDMARMAADPEIQRELQAIQEDFSGTENDGLEKF